MISLRRLRNLITLKAFGRDFARDERGVSAIEFAFVCPILIFAYIGLAELTLGMMATRRTSHLAATLGDLAAQSDTLTAANITDLWTIGNNMMEPFTTTDATVTPAVALLKMRLTMVTMTSGKATVIWSQTSNWTKLTSSDTEILAITTAQVAEGESLVVTDVEYDYNDGSLFKYANLLPGMNKFTETFYHHPRSGAAIPCTGCT